MNDNDIIRENFQGKEVDSVILLSTKPLLQPIVFTKPCASVGVRKYIWNPFPLV